MLGMERQALEDRRPGLMPRSTLALLLAGLCLLVGCQDRQVDTELRQREDAFAATLAGAQLVIDGTGYRLQRLERGPEQGQWTLHATFRFAGIDLTLGVPTRLDWAGEQPVLVFTAVRVLAFGPYDTSLLFAGERWCGVWTGPGGEGGHLGGTLIPASPATPPTTVR